MPERVPAHFSSLRWNNLVLISTYRRLFAVCTSNLTNSADQAITSQIAVHCEASSLVAACGQRPHGGLIHMISFGCHRCANPSCFAVKNELHCASPSVAKQSKVGCTFSRWTNLWANSGLTT